MLIAASTLAVGGITAYVFQQSDWLQSNAEQSSELSLPQIKTVTALGRLEPQGEVIKVSAPTSAEGSRVEQLLVREGDWVKAQQVIAILDSRNRLQTALDEATEQVGVAQANLARVQAGAKTGEIEAQQATIARIEVERRNDIEAQMATVARLEAELENARIEDQRYQMLYGTGAISASQRDSKHLDWETAQKRLQEASASLNRIRLAQQQQLNEAKATLERIAEVRPVDVEVATAEVAAAEAALKRAQANFEQAEVRVPQEGQVIEIHTRPGELISSKGIAEIGQTSQMYAVAEVYESDISKIELGQQARLSSNSLPYELQGSVEQIGLQVQRQEVVNTDPSANIDARIVEVRVRLDQASSKKVAGLTNLQVKVVINL
ncbi:MAG: ABC exporter membrane fusion protein [Symploca sp. SIO2E9]|nr:ABC exporter membrane fusion protein [Symploca sp. SIO2E9]